MTHPAHSSLADGTLAFTCESRRTHTLDTGRVVGVLGSTGFLGGSVACALGDLEMSPVLISRRIPILAENRTISGLASVSELTRAFEGIDVLVHAASFSGSDAALAQDINVTGTANVVAAATAAGVNHMIYLSTIGVYGTGPFTGQSEGELPTKPTSALSSSKLQAERSIREFGGIVVRSAFVYGDGDRWFAPGYTAILTKLQAWINDGRSRLSVIAKEDLGRAVAGLALHAADLPEGAIYHGAAPHPVRQRDLDFLANSAELPTASVSLEEARARADVVGLPRRLVDLAGVDHVVGADAVWRDARIAPPSPLVASC